MAAAAGVVTLTEQQRRAATQRDASIVLSSGAGCGKTSVLTERYLGYLRDGLASVGQIVAITFTDRAARQMRQKIRQAVHQEIRRAPADAAAERWSEHLRDLETAPIGTIHAFCAQLLRQHAIEAGLDPQFDVLEDVLSANLETDALTACLSELLPAQTPVGEDLRQLVLIYGWRPTIAAIQHLMQRYDERPWTDWLRCSPEQIAVRWSEQRAALRPVFLAYLFQGHPKLAPCLTELRTLVGLPAEIQARTKQVLQDVSRLAEATDPATVLETIRETATIGRKELDWPTPEVKQTVQDAFEVLRNKLPAELELFCQEDDNLKAAAATGQRFLRVATEAVQAYQRAKRRASVLDFQDLLVRARDLLSHKPEIRARLQQRYRYLLIDELQDTDPVQMELVEALAGAGLTGGKLFAVGDYKQSIYRFRGADAQLFLDFRQVMPSEGRLRLDVNFRSQPKLLHFTNALLGGMDNYEPLTPHHQQINEGPCVEFLWCPREDKESATEARRREADWIARRIAGMVAAEEKLVVQRGEDDERLRPVRLGDVVLLFRAMSNVALYEAALRDHGLDYYLVGGRAFFAQQEIYDLLNLLRALENPQDAVSLAGTLRSPFCCLSDEALYLLARHPDGLWAGLRDDAVHQELPDDQREPADRARRFLQRWRSLKDRLPIARLLGEVLADSGYDAALQFEQLGDRKLANLWKLIDLARTFDRSGLFGLADFVQRLSDLVRSQPREEQAATQPENADVVRLMSIHQAKGLEFPVVIVPDFGATGGGPHTPVAHWDRQLGSVVRPPADEDPPPFSDLAWKLWRASEEVADWHEDLRTLYVACTRAQDFLVLSAAVPERFRPANTWMLTLANRFNLETGACIDPAIPPNQRPQVRVFSRLHPLPGPVHRARPRAKARESWDPDLGRNVGPVICSDREPFVVPVAWLAERPASVDMMEPEPNRQTARERAVRAVLERWNGQEAEGWRSALAGLAADEPRVADLGPQLQRFTASQLYRGMAAAPVSYRNLEFLLPWPAVGLPFDGQSPVLQGVIDWLWQDDQGDWHLLALETEKGSAARSGTALPRHLVSWVWAFQQQFQQWPISVTLYSLATGRSRTWRGADWQTGAAWESLAAALKAWSGPAHSP